MKGLFDEISEIPVVARKALQGHTGLRLPVAVPYIGMGSSYYAAQAMRYVGRNVDPQIASEYYGYLSTGRLENGVLLSQSGESSETTWCRDLFESFVAIVNDSQSTLALDSRAEKVVDLMAGPEKFSSTKTFVNMLVVLYLGLGIDPSMAVEKVEREFDLYVAEAQRKADEIATYFERHGKSSAYVVGSGPNVGTAGQIALVLSETLKRSWVSMPIAQYDHGPKETATDSVVLLLDAKGRETKRMQTVRETVSANSNALIVDLIEDEVGETLSTIPLATRAFLLMNALADSLQVGDTFMMGDKITLVSDEHRPHS